MNHGGVHVDGPNHLFEGAPAAGDYPLERLIGRLRLLDARSFLRGEPIPRFSKSRCGSGILILAECNCA
jgi:kynurenine formamidase